MSNVVYTSGSYTTPVNLAPTFVDEKQLGRRSVKIYCNNCSEDQLTRVESKITSAGWMWAGITCCILYNPFLCLLPCCLPHFREYSHYCKSCRTFLGVYRPTLNGYTYCLFFWLVFLAIVGPIVAGLLVYFHWGLKII